MEHPHDRLPSDAAPQSGERLFFVVYLGRGEYALDLAVPKAPPLRLAKARSLAGVRRHLAKFAVPGDLVYMSEVLGALTMLSLPLERRTRLATAFGGDLFRHLGAVELVPEAPGKRGSGTRAPERAPWGTRLRRDRAKPRRPRSAPKHRLEGLLPPDEPGSDDAPSDGPESLN